MQTATIQGSEAPQDELRAAIERVLAEGEPVVLSGLAVPYPPLPGEGPSAGPPLRAAVILPLTARGHTRGTLTLAHSNPGRAAPAYDMALVRDFAARAAIALDNARLYREVQEADRRKNEFLSMLAHELRNPLAPIRNGLHILNTLGNVEPQIRNIRDMLERQVQHLVRLVDDLLDISRITRGKINLKTERVDLAVVVHRAVETCAPLIESRRHRLTVTAPSVRVSGDAVRLAQVVGNLLHNAAKFTEEVGQIGVTVAREGEQAVIRVRDSGMGIPPELLGSVFDLFTQADRTLDRSQGGLGIGLTLVRRLVEMHAGTVEVHSAGAGRGSEFVVRLPLLKDEEPRTRDEGPASAGSSPLLPCASRRILVVDDNRDAAESLALLLEVGGHQVRVCHDGPSALGTAAEFCPEAVLLDIGLPGMNGYEVARRLRALPGANGLLLVALTGYGQQEDQRLALEAGFDHHLVKPADLGVLAALLGDPRPAAAAPRPGTNGARDTAFPADLAAITSPSGSAPPGSSSSCRS